MDQWGYSPVALDLKSTQWSETDIDTAKKDSPPFSMKEKEEEWSSRLTLRTYYAAQLFKISCKFLLKHFNRLFTFAKSYVWKRLV